MRFREIIDYPACPPPNRAHSAHETVSDAQTRRHEEAPGRCRRSRPAGRDPGQKSDAMSLSLHTDWWYPANVWRAGELADQIGLCSLKTFILPARVVGYVLYHDADAVLFRLGFADIVRVEQLSEEPDVYVFLVPKAHRHAAETWLQEHCADNWCRLEYTSASFSSNEDKARLEAALQANVSTLQDGAMVL